MDEREEYKYLIKDEDCSLSDVEPDDQGDPKNSDDDTGSTSEYDYFVGDPENDSSYGDPLDTVIEKQERENREKANNKS